MLNEDTIIEYFEHTIAEYQLNGNVAGLKQIQTAAGVLMGAAERAGDKPLVKRFQIVAARAANTAEAVGKK